MILFLLVLLLPNKVVDRRRSVHIVIGRESTVLRSRHPHGMAETQKDNDRSDHEVRVQANEARAVGYRIGRSEGIRRVVAAARPETPTVGERRVPVVEMDAEGIPSSRF